MASETRSGRPSGPLFRRAVQALLEDLNIAALYLDGQLSPQWHTRQAGELLNLPALTAATGAASAWPDAILDSALREGARAALDSQQIGQSTISNAEGLSLAARFIPIPGPAADSGEAVLITLNDTTGLAAPLQDHLASRWRLQQRLARSLAGHHIVNWLWNPTTDQITWAENTLKTLGIEQSAPATTLRSLSDSWIHPEDRERFLEFATMLCHGGPGAPIEFRIRRGDGEERWIEAVADRPDAGEPIADILFTAQDLTPRKRVEQALRENEEMLVAGARIAEIGVAEWNFAQDTARVSDNWRKIHGIREHPMTSTGFERVTHPRDLSRIRRALEDALALGTRYDPEYRIIRQDTGELRVIKTYGEIVRNPDGSARGMYTASLDVTEARRAETELRNSEEKYRIVADLADDWVYWLGADAALLYNSPSCERITGYPDDAFLLDPGLIPAVIHPGDRASFERHILEASSSAMEDGGLEFRILTRDGQIRWIHQRCKAVYSEHGCYLGVRVSNRDISELKKTDDVLKAQRAKLQSIFRTAPVGIGIEVDGFVREVNDALCTMSGYSREELLGQTLALLSPTSSGASEIANPQVRPFAEAGTGTLDREWQRKDGAIIRVLLNGAPLDAGDPGAGIAFTALDITEQTRTEQALKEREEEFRLLFEMANDGVVLHALASDTATDRFIRVNQVTCRMLGYTARELQRMTPADIQAPDDVSEPSGEAKRIQDTGKLLFEKILIDKDGRRFPAEIHSSLFEHRGQQMVLSLIRDVTERKEAESQIRRLAFYDPLTQLPNRRLLMERMQQALNTCKRHPWHGAILFIDLDNFKALNDTHGHDAGDRLLVQVAKRLTSCLRSQDTVARLGGDEFVVMLEHLSILDQEAAEQARDVAQKILATLGVAYSLDGHECRNSPSIGISLFQGKGETIDGVMKRADVAMYRAKSMGRNTLCFFDPNIQVALEARARTELELRQALPNEEFELYFQKQVDSAMDVIGLEALLRWNHPDRGLMLPGDFIPLAEDSGLIIPIGQWVLNTACKYLRLWETKPAFQHLRLALNISANQFRGPDFIPSIRSALERWGANPSQLRFELPVDLFLEEVEETIDKMRALRSLGIGLAIDNFGSGYASLAYLQRLPLDQLKIDRSFVRDVATDANDAVVVRTIISMAKQLGLQVVAEGVENETQAALLRDLACDAFQGFLFGKPIAAVEFSN